MRRTLSSGAAKSEVGLGEKIVAGALTGALGAAIANPLDVVRVRMTCEGGSVDAQTGLLTTGMRTGAPGSSPPALCACGGGSGCDAACTSSRSFPSGSTPV